MRWFEKKPSALSGQLLAGLKLMANKVTPDHKWLGGHWVE